MTLQSDIRLVVGLGNPGVQYHCTRHNIGFWVVDFFLSSKKKKAGRLDSSADGARFSVRGREVWFLKPQNYMNRSGPVVAAFAEDLGVTPRETLVIYDDADLPEGRVQFRPQGGAGGHNGLQSILDHWGQRDFWRLRIGVDKVEDRDLSDYLLEPVASEMMEKLAESGRTALEEALYAGPVKAMNRFNPIKEEAPKT